MRSVCWVGCLVLAGCSVHAEAPDGSQSGAQGAGIGGASELPRADGGTPSSGSACDAGPTSDCGPLVDPFAVDAGAAGESWIREDGGPHPEGSSDGGTGYTACPHGARTDVSPIAVSVSVGSMGPHGPALADIRWAESTVGGDDVASGTPGTIIRAFALHEALEAFSGEYVVSRDGVELARGQVTLDTCADAAGYGLSRERVRTIAISLDDLAADGSQSRPPFSHRTVTCSALPLGAFGHDPNGVSLQVTFRAAVPFGPCTLGDARVQTLFVTDRGQGGPRLASVEFAWHVPDPPDSVPPIACTVGETLVTGPVPFFPCRDGAPAAGRRLADAHIVMDLDATSISEIPFSGYQCYFADCSGVSVSP